MQPQGKSKYVVPRPRNLYNFIVALFVAVGSLCYGYASSISAALIGQPSFYDYMGLTEGTPLLLLGFFNLCTVPGNLFNGLFIDRFGRRRFVLTGCVGIIVCLSGEAAMTAQFVETMSNNRVGLGFGVFLIFAYVCFYSSCLDATIYLVPSEIFPMVIRSFGMSFSIMGQFIATVILFEAAPTAFQNIGYKFWIILICLTFIYGVLVYFYLPETKGKTLEDISLLFGDPVELSFEQAFGKEHEGDVFQGGDKAESTHQIENL